MALSCPNKSLPEWKRLVDEVGEREALNDYFQFGTIRSPYAVKDKLERLNIANYTNENFKIGERYFKPTVESLIDVEKNSSVVDAMVTHFGYRGLQSEEDLIKRKFTDDIRPVEPVLTQPTTTTAKSQTETADNQDVQSQITEPVAKLFESNPELAHAVYSKLLTNSGISAENLLSLLEKDNVVEKDCTGGKLKAEKGLVTSFTKGSQWEIVKDLKGYPSHAQGGVDIKLGKDGFSFARNEGLIKAAHGLVLPAIKAKDGILLPDDKKKINFEHNPYVAVQDNTYVAPKVIIMPLEQKKEQQFIPREQPILKADTRTEQQRKIAQDYTESVLNPSIGTQVGETFQKPLRWLADPIKGVGDIVSAVAPKSALAKDLPNTNEDIFEYRKKQLNPYTSNSEKLNNAINEARDLTINSLINVGTMELGFALPSSFTNPMMANMFKVGSKANFAADLLQLSKMDLDKLEKGDMEEIGNIILNSASLLSKMDNFDASTIYNNIKNWKNISKADKIDTYKDIFNLSQSINQQTQRND